MTRGTPSELGALSAYLLRSTTLPLDLEFHIPAFSDTTIPYITTACQMLAPHSVRFSRLSVACETSECGFHFFECLAYVHVPILKHLEIMSTSLSQTDEGVISSLKIFTQGTPSLQSARFRGIGLQNCLPHLSTITFKFLHIHCLFGDMQISYHELHCALQGFSALTRLILSGGDVLYDWSSAVPIIVLPVLQFLHIGTDPSCISTDVSGVLLTISAPSLESLVLNDVWAKELKVFFRSTTSNPSQFLSLRSLTIGFVDEDWDPLIWTDLSRAFPTIIRLSLSNQETPSFVEFLQLSPADEINECKVYWPDLQMLAFLAHSDADEVMICDIVSARIAFGRPLQRICLSESTMNEVRDQLEWLRERVEVEQAGNPTVSWDDSRLRAIEEDVMVVCACEHIPSRFSNLTFAFDLQLAY
jgi:hypothetical protein